MSGPTIEPQMGHCSGKLRLEKSYGHALGEFLEPVEDDGDLWVDQGSVSTLASDDMSDHNPRERRLFRDLQEKSVLTRQVQRLASSIAESAGPAPPRDEAIAGGPNTPSPSGEPRRRWRSLSNKYCPAHRSLDCVCRRNLKSQLKRFRSSREQHMKEVMELKAAHQALRTAEQALSGAELASEARDKARPPCRASAQASARRTPGFVRKRRTSKQWNRSWRPRRATERFSQSNSTSFSKRSSYFVLRSLRATRRPPGTGLPDSLLSRFLR